MEVEAEPEKESRVIKRKIMRDREAKERRREKKETEREKIISLHTVRSSLYAAIYKLRSDDRSTC